MRILLTNTSAASTINTPYGRLPPSAQSTVETTPAAFIAARTALDGNASLQYHIESIPVNEFGVLSASTAAATANTTVLQSALDYAYAYIQAASRPLELVFPPYLIPINGTLVVKGNSSLAPALVGCMSSTAFGVQACGIKWAGADNGVMMYTESFNKGVIRDLFFYGNDKAGLLLHISASTYADPTVLAACSGMRIERCRFKQVKVGVVGNGCVALGTDPALVAGATYQASEAVFRDCDFVGESSGAAGFTYAGMKAYGIKSLAGGNCKNFAAYDCTWNNCNKPVDWTEASGNFNIYNFNVADCLYGVAQGGGHLVINGGDIEAGHTPDFRFLYGTGGGGECTADVSSIECLTYLLGTTGTMIDWGGQLSLRNCKFVNGNSSVSGNVDIPNPFKIIINLSGAAQPGCLTSEGNLYVGVTDYAPFYDGSGNRLAPIAGLFGGENPQNVRSWGDVGTLDQTDSPLPLGSFDLKTVAHYSSIFNGPNTYSSFTGVGAHVGGGQGSATAIINEVTFVTSVASAGDSVKLPAGGLGKRFLVINDGANSVDIFPATGGTIDALAANGAYSLAAGSTREFFGKSATLWRTR